MNKEYALEVANTIREQLFALTNTNVLFSWGIRRLSATTVGDCAALKIEVTARLFRGSVLVALNSSDYYDIYLFDPQKGLCQIAEDVSFDQLGDTIDRKIERGDDPKAYAEFCSNEFKKLMHGDIF
jgi:hypothetical protein